MRQLSDLLLGAVKNADAKLELERKARAAGARREQNGYRDLLSKPRV